MLRLRPLLILLIGLCLCAQSHAEVLRLAVASNFKPALLRLLETFNAEHPDIEVQISAGASGQLYAQIRQGAPFDVFLSADAYYPTLLFQQQLAQTPQAYAHGKLVLISHQSADNWQSALAAAERVALANPDFAPYGNATQRLLMAHDYWPLNARLITGNNVAQVQHWFTQHHVDVAFTAASLQNDGAKYTQFDLTPLLATPIEQKLVILTRTEIPQAANTLVQYLRQHRTQAQLATLGYVPLTPGL